jgi:CBS domain-containing protein
MSATTSTSAAEGPHVAFVNTHTVYQVMRPRKEIFRVKDSDTLLKAFHKIQSHNVLSLPVYDEIAHRFFGVIDCLDLCNFFTDIAHAYADNKKSSWADFVATEEKFNEATCGSVRNESKHDSYTQIMPNANLTTAISLMTLFPGVHRLAVVGPYPTYELLGVLTQSDLLAFIWEQLGHEDAIFSKTVQQLELGKRHVICVPLHHKMADAWKTIKTTGVSGIAVVDADGILCGNISASDIKLDKDFSIDSIVELSQKPVSAIVEQQKKKWAKKHAFPVTLTSSATVADVIKLVMDNHVHRVYVIDDHKQVIGVITLGDLLGLFHAFVKK